MSNQSQAKENGTQGASERSYSEELFGKGLYGRHHRARFEWLRRKIAALADASKITVLEVGCHDGRVLGYMPRTVRRYVGLDAGWEGGLERARRQFAEKENYVFLQSTKPEDVANLTESFNFIICMGTLEHLDPPIVEQYVQAFSAKLDGFLLITVPNEKGIALLIKATAARIIGIDRIYPYTAGEFFWALLGRLNRVHRIEHKGFDYASLVSLIKEYFRYVSVEGITPFRLPLQLSLTVGITGSQKRTPSAYTAIRI